MTVLPLQRLRAFWNYLPAFRVVAETGHLPTAARTLGLSPPALSRSIRLLEDGLGWAAFERRSRALHLTPRGRALLEVVRLAMRNLDEISGGAAGPDATPLRATFALDAAWLAPALLAALATGAAPIVVQQVPYPRDPPAALLRGEVDLVVHGSHRVVAGIDLQRIGDVPWCVALAPGRRTGEPRLMATAPGDPWPAARPRGIGAEATALADLPAIVGHGTLAALLPEPVVRAAGLRRHGAPIVRVPVFASCRPAVGARPALDAALAALRTAATARR